MEMNLTTLPEHWLRFLTELDGQLAPLGGPCEFHCIGGFAFTVVYGLPRTTSDLDFYRLVPRFNYQRFGTKRSELGKKHGLWIQGAGHAELPLNYTERLKELAPGTLKYIRLLIPDPYDLILSKIERNQDKDRTDVSYLFKACKLKIDEFRERFEEMPLIVRFSAEGRSTLESWTEMLQGEIKA